MRRSLARRRGPTPGSLARAANIERGVSPYGRDGPSDRRPYGRLAEPGDGGTAVASVPVMRRTGRSSARWLALSFAVLSASVCAFGVRTAAAQTTTTTSVTSTSTTTSTTLLPPCAAAPLPCALSAGKLKLDLTTRRLVWKWKARRVVDMRDLSHPTIDTGFDLCLYDAGNALVMTTGVPPAGVCNGKACWRARPWGYQYRDPAALSAGITHVTLRALTPRDRFQVKGEGDQLPLPAVAPALPITVQLVRTNAPEKCWGSVIDRLR